MNIVNKKPSGTWQDIQFIVTTYDLVFNFGFNRSEILFLVEHNIFTTFANIYFNA